MKLSATTTSGRIAETFFSIQGEGATVGVPAVFIRLQGCSVGCRWCDTKYSWASDGGRGVDLDALIAEATGHPGRRVVITGGEPLESSLFLPIVTALHQRGFVVEVETSGTVEPPREASPSIQWNVSLKLAGSGVEDARRINPDAIRAFVERGAWWKFVVTDEGDVAEALSLAGRFALPRERILLQPEAMRPEELIERSPWVIEACKRHGLRFSPRLHILIWGARRGV
jgi:7-carboxy-7-deazaguanine synthase